jgi:HEAT repeat protein
LGSRALALIDPRRRSESVSAILRFLDGGSRSDASRQIAAAEALGFLGKNDASVVRALIGKSLEYENRVRREALRSLKRIGADISETFLDALRDGDDQVRAAATEGLGVLSSEHPGVIPALIEALGDDEADVCIAAAESLGAFGPRATGAVPALEAARKGRHRGLRQAAAEALAKIREPLTGR